MAEAPYYVWRRSDGYVSSTRYPPRDDRDTFEILLVTPSWPAAKMLIEKERSS